MQRMHNINVLVTCANSQVFPEVAAALKSMNQFKIRLIGVDSGDNFDIAQAFADHAYKVPSGIDLKYADKLLEICLKEQIDVVLFGSDEEQLAATEVEEKFVSCGVNLATEEKAKLDLISDKLLIIKFLESKGLRVPKYLQLDDENYKAQIQNFYSTQGRYIFKPRIGRGSRGLKLVDKTTTDSQIFNQKDNFLAHNHHIIEYLQNHAKEIQSWVISEYLVGEKYSSDIICEGGEIKYICTRSNGNAPKIRPPTQYATVVGDSEVQDYCENVCRHLNYSGFLQIETGKDNSGTVKLIEINTRLDASLVITEATGVNFYEHLILTTLGLDSSVECRLKDSHGLKFVRYWQHFFGV